MKLSLILSRLFSLGLICFGLILLVGGIKLLSIGGSAWYGITGAALIVSGALLWFGNRWGSWLYGFMLAYTMVWSLWEVGFNGWALLPRLLVLSVLGLWLLTPFAQRRLQFGPRSLLSRFPSFKPSVAGLFAIPLVVMIVTVLALKHGDATDEHAAATPAETGLVTTTTGDWRNYGNDTAGTRYSELAQITSRNVAHLKLAWSFKTGDSAKPRQAYNFENTPLKIGRLLYLCTPSGQVFALDATTGKQDWHFVPESDLKNVRAFVCRGVSYYDTGLAAGACAQRIYVPTPDAKLWGVDALTGKVCADFGVAGVIDLTVGLGEVTVGTYAVTSPPVVTRGKLILGARVDDNLSVDMPSGVVRAFDAITGKLVWAWDIGQPDRRDAPPLNEIYTRSTPNAWAPMVADEQLGLIFIPTGNPAADFWGKKRRTFDDEYGSSLVAVDVSTGETRWRFQATHHDVWDNDLSSQPVLVDIPTATGLQPAVIAGTKQGHIFVLNRMTGVPIVPVSEKPAPGPSNIGEQLAATQPVSALSVNPGPATLTEATMWGMTPIDHMWCRIQYRKARYEGPYTPPGVDRASIIYPGMFGGIEWGGVTIDPVHKILITNPNAMPFMVKKIPVQKLSVASIDPRQPEAVATAPREILGTGYADAYWGFLSPLAIPCMQPPWGKLYAIDLQTNKVMWERPVGTIRDSGPLGFASHMPLLIGTPQVGGTIVTRGGLIFSAATLDQYLRAYDLATGKELWKARLPAGGQATPMTFQADDRQFVVIAAGGHGALGTKKGDHVLAYALDE